MDLIDTQTPNTGCTVPESQLIKEKEQIKAIWGRLFPIHISLESVDLIKNSFSVGRSPDCDVVINEKIFSLNRCQVVSKIHFMITKDVGSPAYITDLSKNGTFINGIKIGKGKKNILQNDDEISMGILSLKAYIFKSISSEESSFLPPELNKKYEISKLLGIGACGEVRLVYDKKTCLKFAVKKIVKANTSKVYKINHVDRIYQEIEIMKNLRHPNVIKLKEIVESEEAVFIVLEYLEGGELSDYISLNLSESQCKLLFYQITLAVKYLHEKGIAHRDLKPANVLMKTKSPQSLLKLTDFGLSKLVNDEDTMLRTVCGTPCFVAPEILDGKKSSYDLKVDIWSMGVILFYMLSKELPFQNEDRISLGKQILKGKYEMPSNKWQKISEEAKDLVQKMLIVNPQQRINIKEILNHPWLSKDIYIKGKIKELILEEDDSQENLEAPFKRKKTGISFLDSSIRSENTSSNKDEENEKDKENIEEKRRRKSYEDDDNNKEDNNTVQINQETIKKTKNEFTIIKQSIRQRKRQQQQEKQHFSIQISMNSNKKDIVFSNDKNESFNLSI